MNGFPIYFKILRDSWVSEVILGIKAYQSNNSRKCSIKTKNLLEMVLVCSRNDVGFTMLAQEK